MHTHEYLANELRKASATANLLDYDGTTQILTDTIAVVLYPSGFPSQESRAQFLAREHPRGKIVVRPKYEQRRSSEETGVKEREKLERRLATQIESALRIAKEKNLPHVLKMIQDAQHRKFLNLHKNPPKVPGGGFVKQGRRR